MKLQHPPNILFNHITVSFLLVALLAHSSTFQAGFSHPYHLQHDGRDMSRHNHYMLADARLKMETSQYEATIDETVLRCTDKLPWWDVAQQ